VTLIDFAADKRAPTPTAAAEMAVPVRADLIARVEKLASRAFSCWRHHQEGRRTELRAAARALPSRDALLAQPRQRLDTAAERLPRALIANTHQHHAAFALTAARLSPQLLQARVTRGRERARDLSARAERAVRVYLARRTGDLDRAGRLLAALSYPAVLKRGFALVRGPDDRPLHSAAAIPAGTRLAIEFSDGVVGATADGPLGPRRGGRKRRGGSDPDQGSLF
jgi:exodeoxyribonuclease VII large subunit